MTPVGITGAKRGWSKTAERLLPSRRLLVVVAVFGTALAAAAVLLSWRAYEERVSRELDSVSNAAVEAALLTERFFTSRLGVLALMAETPAVQSADPSEMDPYLTAFADATLGFGGGIGWIDDEGMLQIEVYTRPGPFPLDLSDRSYVQSVLATGLPVVSEVVLARRTGDPLVVLAVPTKDDAGRLTGLLIASVPMKEISEIIPSLHLDEGATFIIDRFDNLVYSNQALIDLDPPPNPTVADSALNHVRDGVVGVTGQPGQIVSAALVPSADWTVIVERPQSDAIGAARTVLIGELAVLVLLVIVGGFGAWAAARRTDRLHQRLVAHTTDLEALEAFTETLVTAETLDDVAAAVFVHGPLLIGGVGVRLRLSSDTISNEWTEVAAIGSPTSRVFVEIENVRPLGLRARSWLGTVTDLATQAVERARLRAAETSARQDAERLAALAMDLAGATDRNDVVNVVLRTGSVLEGTVSVALGLVHHPTATIRVRHTSGPADDGLVLEMVDLAANHPMAAAIASGRPGFYATVESIRQKFPDTADRITPDAVGASAFIPLGEDPVDGVVAFEFGQPMDFGQRELALLTTAGRIVAEALEVATTYEREHSVAITLQNSLRPAVLPAIRGWHFSGAYHAGEADTVVGGDWYDFLQLEDGRMLLTVGDVSGRGIAAASTMGILRAAMRAYALTNADPAFILESADALLATSASGQIATALVILVDPVSAAILYSSAGHLPPLLVTEDDVSFLTPTADVLLGASGGAARSTNRLVLAPGASLVLITDGVIERRDESIEIGMKRLSSAARRHAVGELRADLLLADLLAEAPSVGDDAVVLVMSRHRGGTPGY